MCVYCLRYKNKKAAPEFKSVFLFAATCENLGDDQPHDAACDWRGRISAWSLLRRFLQTGKFKFVAVEFMTKLKNMKTFVLNYFHSVFFPVILWGRGLWAPIFWPRFRNEDFSSSQIFQWSAGHSTRNVTPLEIVQHVSLCLTDQLSLSVVLGNRFLLLCQGGCMLQSICALLSLLAVGLRGWWVPAQLKQIFNNFLLSQYN